ncbi:MAG: class I SAM-dependent methyltransferase [Candidatus Magasanikbacteria bacterium]|jgi:tRNA (cmo5U34)-methyltransferase
MKTTNVKPSQLNYDHYSLNKYDRDIVNSIPHHLEIHYNILNYAKKAFVNKNIKMLDLGVGTGLTSKLIKDVLPNSKLTVVDFSRQMINSAKKKLGKNVKYVYGDYSKIKFDIKYDLIVSVIGIHHQNTAGKKKLFKKIYSLLKSGGVFIFGDLVTYQDKHTAALNNALHFHHLVENATDKKTLTEWAYHHMFLNDLAPIEDQIKWLKNVGFKVELKFLRTNTALIVCKK